MSRGAPITALAQIPPSANENCVMGQINKVLAAGRVSPFYDSAMKHDDAIVSRCALPGSNSSNVPKGSTFHLSFAREPAAAGEPAGRPRWHKVESLDAEFVMLGDDDAAFRDLLLSVHAAINKGRFPQRTATGSSGSYTVRCLRSDGAVGIFKPRDEEPYAELNPRWTKWIHKNFFPCLFGRECLMPNGGYLSEAMASIVDRFFQLRLVPRTEVIELSSPTFYARPGAKVGSFQVYVHGFEAAGRVLPVLDMLSIQHPGFAAEFQQEFERLTVLDYIIRNTDRTLDNWMVKMVWVHNNAIVSEQLVPSIHSQLTPIVKIAAIDHGLAFPWKHPTGWRTFPYSWAELPQARIPYSRALCQALLPVLNDPSKWEQLTAKLHGLVISIDASARPYLHRQMSVLRGQLWNLRLVLSADGGCPADLLAMPPMRVEADDEYFWKRYGRTKGYGGFVKSAAVGGGVMWIREVDDSQHTCC